MGSVERWTVVLTCVVEKEGTQFVSYCEELGTSSCGDTIEEAFENIEPSRSIEEVGELGRVFRERGHRGPSQTPWTKSAIPRKSRKRQIPEEQWQPARSSQHHREGELFLDPAAYWDSSNLVRRIKFLEVGDQIRGSSTVRVFRTWCRRVRS